MEEKYTYSFIIPHKNCPELLQRCVDSIPVREDVQIIIVDDNSDADKKPSSKRENVEVVLLDSKQAKGAGRARNVGLEHAQGKWLLFADSDDYYVASLLDALDSYKDDDIDVLYFGYQHVLVNDRIEIPKYNDILLKYKDDNSYIEKVKYALHAPWNKMIRKSFVANYYIRFEEVPNGNDIFFTLQVGMFTKKIAVETTPLYNYIFQQNSIVNKKKKNNEEMLCKLIHRSQVIEFRKYIGINLGKNSNIVYYLMQILKNQGASTFFNFVRVYLCNYNKISKESKNYIRYFVNHGAVSVC